MYFAVDIPWGIPRPKEVFLDSDKKTWFYKGPILPKELRIYRAPDFSRERWQEDEKNGLVSPPEQGEVNFEPRPHQLQAASAIADSYTRGHSGFLLADKTGLGKTLSALVGISLIAKQQGRGMGGKGKLLVVCPKGVIPQWRNTLKSYRLSHSLLRVAVINYQQLQKLLDTPPQARVQKKTGRKNKQIARYGKPLLDFDYVIFDEAHKLKNYPSSLASQMAVTMAKLDSPYVKGSSPFTLFSTATPGASPLNFAVMSGWLSKLIAPNLSKPVPPKSWGEFLSTHGFAVTKGKSGYAWATIPWFGKNSTDPKERQKFEAGIKKAQAVQRADAQRIGKALLSRHAPFLMRSPKDIAGWPEQQFIPLPIELTSKQKLIYAEAWTRFRNFLNLSQAKKDPKSALVENLRYRQKSSLLRVDALVEHALEAIEEGKQVYISCEFLETLSRFRESFEKKKLVVAEISGRTTETREQERLKFQRGEASVVLSTVVEGISLHAKEVLPDGTKATATERVSIIADIRQNPLDALQTAGRAHRDGENSITYMPYAEDSVDKKVVDSFINKVTNMKKMLGASVADSEELDRIFRKAAASRTPPNRLS